MRVWLSDNVTFLGSWFVGELSVGSRRPMPSISVFAKAGERLQRPQEGRSLSSFSGGCHNYYLNR